MAGTEIYEIQLISKGFDELKEANARLNAFNRTAKATGVQVGGFNNAVNSFGATLRSNTFAIRNMGFQLQDMAVQIAGGQGALRALSQQLPQLLGGFNGIGVVVAGLVAATMPAILTAFRELGWVSGDAREDLDNLAKTMGDLNDKLETSLRPLREYTEEFGRWGRTIRQLEVDKAAQDVAATMDTFTQALEANAQGLIDLSAGGGGAAEAVNRIGQAAGPSLLAVRALGERIQNLQNLDFSDRIDEAIALRDRAIELYGSLDKLPEPLRRIVSAMEVFIRDAARSTTTLKKYNDEIERQGDAWGYTESQMERYLARSEQHLRYLRTWRELTGQLETSPVPPVARPEDIPDRPLPSRVPRVAPQVPEGFRDLQREIERSYTESERLERAINDLQRNFDQFNTRLTREELAQFDVAMQNLVNQRTDANFKSITDAINGLRTPAENARLQADALAESLERLRTAGRLADFDPAMLERLAEHIESLRNFQKEVNELDQAFDQLGNIMSGNLGSAFDSIIDGTQSVQSAFKDMTVGILRDIAKFMVNSQIQRFFTLLASSFSNTSFGASLAPALGLSPSRAVVGPPPAPPVGLASVPRLVVGSAPSVAPAAARQRESAAVQVNVYNEAGDQVEARAEQNSKGDVDVYIENRVKKMFGSGKMDAMMKANFGVRRSGG